MTGAALVAPAGTAPEAAWTLSPVWGHISHVPEMRFIHHTRKPSLGIRPDPLRLCSSEISPHHRDTSNTPSVRSWKTRPRPWG